MKNLFRNAASLTLILSVSFALTACKKKPVEDDVFPEMDAEVEMEGDSSELFMGTVTDLLKRGKDIMCTFTHVEEGATVKGTVYISSLRKMAGDFTMENPQFGSINMHLIRDGDYGYTWGYPTENDGTKVKLDADGMPTKQDKNDTGVDEPMEYKCAKWKVDKKKFEIPSHVNFSDISAEVEKINQVMQDVQGMKCDACAQIPDPNAKAQCEAALGC